jgi:hypothetical protein
MNDDVKFPDIEVQLSGEDGNVFAIIGRVRRALRRAGEQEAADEYTLDMTNACSYDEALQITMRTVNVS